MLESDAFANIRARLGMDRQNDLAKVQSILDEWYPKMLYAKRFHQGTLTIVALTPCAGSFTRHPLFGKS